jgi:MFS family permease
MSNGDVLRATGGLATTEAWLIITRGLQGADAAIAAPTALSLIAANFPEGQQRNRALGVYAAVSAGGGAVGLLLGGLLTDLVSWRWVFFVNVPIAAVVLFLAPRALNESSATPGHLDVPGAVTATAGMLSPVYGLSNASIHGWGSLGHPRADTSRCHPARMLRDHRVIGAGAILTGLAWLSRLTVTGGYVDILGPSLLISLGIGLQFVPLTLTLTAVRRSTRAKPAWHPPRSTPGSRSVGIWPVRSGNSGHRRGKKQVTEPHAGEPW